MAKTEKQPTDYHDIVIIGGGISGINSAYRVQQGLPNLSYTILEARDVIGGTWSFFKYPGIRSDSEISSFAFSWAPWDQDTAIADGASILRYLEKTVSKHGIDKNIQFNTQVTHLDWLSSTQRWKVTTKVTKPDIDATATATTYARFIIMGTGYYDYATPMQTTISGVKNFTGQLIHPQFWPSDLNYADKNVVIIGSGATAATLVPTLAKTAKHVTMVQRSPSYYLVVPKIDGLDSLTKRFFSESTAYSLIRMRILLITFLFIHFCKFFPNAASKLLRRLTKAELPPDHALDPHFQPKYAPFEQRLCICPDGDFFHAIREHKAHVETDTVQSIKGRNITLSTGKTIENVDILVTATGLKLHLIGGIQPSIDGTPISIADRFSWRNTCLTDVPNLCFIFGYIDNAWTLGSDSSARLFVRLIRKMEEDGATSFVPVIGDKEKETITEAPLVKLSSGYIERMKDVLPRAATTAPWKPRWHYYGDHWFAERGDLNLGMKMMKGKNAI